MMVRFHREGRRPEGERERLTHTHTHAEREGEGEGGEGGREGGRVTNR